jgi:hypothetical protein
MSRAVKLRPSASGISMAVKKFGAMPLTLMFIDAPAGGV